MTAFTAEIIGTFLLILLGCGVNANVSLKQTYAHGGGWIVITTGWAFAVFVGVVVAAPASGAHLNPAVTLGLATAGIFAWDAVPSYLLAQLLGALLGAFMVWAIYKDHFTATKEKDSIFGVFATSPAISNTSTNLIVEFIGAFVLVFAVLFFTDASILESDSKIGLGSLGALPVALVVWGIGLSLGGTTGYAINPARDLGPRIMHALLPIANKGSSNWSYSWIPIVGPSLGGIFAALLFLFFEG
ncbi:MIP/aquaporin family protein [Eudoraea sp.]|uniref:MIP/aquaporin family protein n=1 Tax=Eudoraea sp. TaxID=1979955 RepID=UPI003C78E6FF